MIFHFSILLAALAQMEEETACEYQECFGVDYISLFGGGGGHEVGQVVLSTLDI